MTSRYNSKEKMENNKKKNSKKLLTYIKKSLNVMKDNSEAFREKPTWEGLNILLFIPSFP